MPRTRKCRCEEVQRKCPSCKNHEYRQRLAQKRLAEVVILPAPRIAHPTTKPVVGAALRAYQPILPAPPKTELERCRALLEQATTLFLASGRGLDPREFKSGKCTSVKGGNKCNRVANITRPRCAYHTAIEEGIEVRHSGMKVGLGAFASDRYALRDQSTPVVFRKGDIISEYRGQILDEDKFSRCYQEHEKAEYAFQISEDPFVVIDARDSTAGVARYINEPPKGMVACAQYEIHPEFPRVKRLICRAKRDILVGEEILARYGTSQGYYAPGEKM